MGLYVMSSVCLFGVENQYGHSSTFFPHSLLFFGQFYLWLLFLSFYSSLVVIITLLLLF